MKCNICVFPLGIIIVAIIIYLRKNVWLDFIKSLGNTQKDEIRHVIKNRIWIIVSCLFISLLLTLFLSKIYITCHFISKICFYIISVVLLTYMGYLLFPKDVYIEGYLNKEQLIQWLSINDFNTFLIICGFLIGFLFFFFSQILKKNILTK